VLGHRKVPLGAVQPFPERVGPLTFASGRHLGTVGPCSFGTGARFG
jgi:hypothetical protein